MKKPIHAAILGASGYGAGELLRLLVGHPLVAVISVTSTSQVGQPIHAVHPHLRGFYDLVVTEKPDCPRLLEAEQAVIFSALPHGASGVALDKLMALGGADIPVDAADVPVGGADVPVGGADVPVGGADVPVCPSSHIFQGRQEGRQECLPHREIDKLQLSNVKFIDLSGDLRLKDAAAHGRAYPESPLLPDRRKEFVYGLPELNRPAILAARCIANPGCLATASILAAAPLVGDCPNFRDSKNGTVPFAANEFRGSLVIDAKTGSSGAGRTPKETTHHPTRHADFRAYKPLDHQHESEILQALGDPRGERIELSFVPQSMAVSRGIFATVHATLPEPIDADALWRHYEQFYAGSPFVRLSLGSPSLENVVGSNFCDIGLAVRGRQVVAMSALDNLVKGMAGAAIQNMNLMCGLPETTGLWTPSLRPV